MASQTIALIGGTGASGQHFVKLALERGHKVKMLARTPAKVEQQQGSPLPANLTVVQGDSAQEADIATLCAGCDVVVSTLGQPPHAENHIMRKSAENILACNPPRVIFVTSLGLCGTAWLVRSVLTLVAGKGNIEDAEGADIVLRSSSVATVVVRPTALADAKGSGKYQATLQSGMSMTSLSKEDLALFLADLLTDTQYDNSEGVQLYAAKDGSCTIL